MGLRTGTGTGEKRTHEEKRELIDSMRSDEIADSAIEHLKEIRGEKRSRRAKYNKEQFQEYWEGVEANLSIDETDGTQRGVTKKIEGNRGGYFFIGSRSGNYQIPMKRVRINEKTIEGILISVNALHPSFNEKGSKVHGVIKKI